MMQDMRLMVHDLQLQSSIYQGLRSDKKKFETKP